jgi:PKD repeat protein
MASIVSFAVPAEGFVAPRPGGPGKLPLAGRTLLLAGRMLALAALVGGLPAAVRAQSCDRAGCGFATCATPAAPAPASLWGEIQPADAVLAPCSPSGPAFCRDSTGFNDGVDLYRAFPWYMGVDVQNGYVITGLAYGLQVWDARTSPANPAPLGQVALSDFPVQPDNPEIKLPLQHVSAPAGIDTVAAVAGVAGVGLGVIDLTDKTLPRLAYQSYSKEGQQVYSAMLNGRQYAFLAAVSGASTGGLYVYDLTQALQYDHCAEAAPAAGASVNCPGVYLGRLGSAQTVYYVAGVDSYVVLSKGSSQGFEIWDVSQPTAAVLRLSGLSSTAVYGVAMWRVGASYYLALRTDSDGRIYDVSCIAAAGGCGSGLGSPLATRALDTGTANFFVTFSQSGATPFLYFGSDDICQGGSQREWLFDVTNPASPRDVSPPNYWGWYYRGNPTGFNNLMPRTGRFVGGYFYRAALSILDIHKWNPGGSPTPNLFVAGPATGQPGQLLTFTATAALCTPGPSGWTWSAPGGSIAGSSTGSSVQVSWSASGEQSVTAASSACGSAAGTRSVAIEPGGVSPVAKFTYSPTTPAPGQAVTFDATSSSGNPTDYHWTFGDGTGGTGRTTAHTYGAAGTYSVTLTIAAPGSGPACPAGTCIAQTTTVLAVGSTPPPDASFTTSASCSDQFGFEQCQAQVGAPVSFTATSPQNSTYTWNFGDGSQATGRAVSHAWSQAGAYTVTLAASNGQQTAFQTMQFQVGAVASSCTASATHLCLLANRFQVDVAWTTSQGASGAGQAVPLGGDTGYFWFFSDANVEMVLKVIDGCALNQSFWVFAGGLTNVQVAITVTDTATSTIRQYSNPQGAAFKPIQDTSAFATCH